MKIMAFGYKKGVGKNTAAKFISTYIRATAPGINVREISFAGKLKDICFQLYGWAGMQRGIYYETHREEKEKILPKIGKSPRQVWIEVGNKLREVYGATWIDFALNGVTADIILITDLRFINEATALRAKGAELVNIYRPDIPQGTDPAEVELDDWVDWDRIIINDEDLRKLNCICEGLAKELLSE